MLLIAWMVLSGPRAESSAAASDARAAALLSDLAQKSETLRAVAARIAASPNDVAGLPMWEHLSRKMLIADAAAAADVCRHLAMIAWVSGRRWPCDALAAALVMQVCSEPLISTSFTRSCSTGPASSGGSDDIERLLPSRHHGTVRPQHSLTPTRCDRKHRQRP